jgi:glutamine kinase
MPSSTKGKTLLKLRAKGFNVPNLILIKEKFFLKNSNKILGQIYTNFKDFVAIRSSALSEDSEKQSLAGKYLSFLNVNPKNKILINKRIKEVIESYDGNENNEIIIQDMVKDSIISGVCTTVDLHNYLPIININYDKSNRTDTVTSGSNNSYTLALFDEKIKKIKDKRINNLLIEVKKLKKFFKSDLLDIEFAINKNNKVFILQVRKIILPQTKKIFSTKIYKHLLAGLEKKIIKLQEKNYDLYGNTNCFGVMPDWNPAEIIGFKPRPLALSLYKELITDHIWSKNRYQYGFKNLESHHLMTTFYGTPYIDIRVDFNSWIPNDLSQKISQKLINFYLNKIRKNNDLHDKVEFEILYTCFTANTVLRLKKELSNKFTKKEITKIKDSLIKINNIAYTASFLDLDKIHNLKKKQAKLNRSKIYSLNKIYFLMEDCKRFGTLPFAGLARCGFIAIDILDSFVKTKIISENEKHKYLSSITNIASNVINDFIRLNKKKFCNIYGHLRPNTYEITSLNYREGYNRYFNIKEKNLRKKNIFNFSKYQNFKISNFLKKNKLNMNLKQLDKFIRESIYNREYAKFIFTKSIDLIFDNLLKFGKKYNINRDDLSFVDINTILNFHYTLDATSIVQTIKEEIKSNKLIYESNSRIHLPETIAKINDLYLFHKNVRNGNFVTQKTINSKFIYYKSIKDLKKLDNKIVIIENADPGYDFIFTRKIRGLITKFGGQNSHMSIRAAELSLPACIGVGEKKFNEILLKKNITLDCLNKKIY